MSILDDTAYIGARHPRHIHEAMLMPEPLRGAWLLGLFLRVLLWIDRR